MIKTCIDSVEHKTPLSPRYARQVAILLVSQIQPAMPQRIAHPRLLDRPFQTLLTIHLRCGRPVPISLFERWTHRVRNFDTAPLFSYCYELQPDHRWEGAANALIAADLRVRPWFSTRAELENRGRCERSK